MCVCARAFIVSEVYTYMLICVFYGLYVGCVY